MPTRSPLRPWHSRQPGTGPSRPRVPSFSRGPAAGCGAGGGVAAAQGTGLVGHGAGGPPAPSARGRAWGETSKVREKQIKLFPFSRNNCLPNCCCNYCPTGKQRERKSSAGRGRKVGAGWGAEGGAPDLPSPPQLFSNIPPDPRDRDPPAASQASDTRGTAKPEQGWSPAQPHHSHSLGMGDTSGDVPAPTLVLPGLQLGGCPPHISQP